MARLLDILNREEWIGLTETLGEIDQVRPDLIQKITLHYEWLFEKTKVERSLRNASKKYSLLVVPPVRFEIFRMFSYIITFSC